MRLRRPRKVKPYKDRQKAAIDFIRYYVHETGAFPTKARIAREFGWRDPASARDMLERLVITGELRRVRMPERGFKYELPSDNEVRPRDNEDYGN